MTRASTWTPIDFTKNVRKLTRVPKRVDVHGTKYSVFWDSQKNVPALVYDTCAHRGASLSAGGHVDGNCVVCKYHGKPTKAFGQGRVTERDGLVWMTDNSAASDAPIPPTSWEFDPGHEQRIFEYERSFKGSNPILLVENTLDFSHLETVHAFHLIEGRPDVTIHRGGYNGKATYAYESKVFNLKIENEYFGPWCTCLRFIFNGEQSFTIHFAVRPDSVDTSTLFVRVSREDQKWLGWLGDKLYLGINELPLIEDKYIVQHADPSVWSKNKLTPDDAFIKEYRSFMKAHHQDILDGYVQ